MTVRVEILVVCSEPGCSVHLTYARINRGGLSMTLAGELAARDGWQVKGARTGRADPSVAYCPKHRRDGQAATADRTARLNAAHTGTYRAGE